MIFNIHMQLTATLHEISYLLTTNTKVPKNSAQASFTGERDITLKHLLHIPAILFQTPAMTDALLHYDPTMLLMH